MSMAVTCANTGHITRLESPNKKQAKETTTKNAEERQSENSKKPQRHLQTCIKQKLKMTTKTNKKKKNITTKADNTDIAFPLSPGICSGQKGHPKKHKDIKTTQCKPQQQKNNENNITVVPHNRAKNPATTQKKRPTPS